MKNDRKYRVLVAATGVILTFLCVTASGQDPKLSQFYANALYLNPGMAGVEGLAKAYVGYRNQWPASGGNYTTYHASYEQYVDELHGGLGFHVMNDRQGGGVLNSTSIDAMYAYHLKVSNFLSVTGGLQASLGQRSLNTEELVLRSDLLNGTATELTGRSRFYPDFSVGFGAFYKRIYGGIAVHHLHQPNISTDGDPGTRLSRRYTAHVGAMIPIYEKRFGREVMQLSPNMIFSQQNIYQQFNYGLELLYKSLLAGVWVRHDLRVSSGTLIFSVGYARDQFRFRYSYDALLSSPSHQQAGMGAHELSMAVVFEKLRKSPRRRAIKSPKI